MAYLSDSKFYGPLYSYLRRKLKLACTHTRHGYTPSPLTRWPVLALHLVISRINLSPQLSSSLVLAFWGLFYEALVHLTYLSLTIASTVVYGWHSRVTSRQEGPRFESSLQPFFVEFGIWEEVGTQGRICKGMQGIKFTVIVCMAVSTCDNL